MLDIVSLFIDGFDFGQRQLNAHFVSNSFAMPKLQTAIFIVEKAWAVPDSDSAAPDIFSGGAIFNTCGFSDFRMCGKHALDIKYVPVYFVTNS